ncbi:4-amino-4-deoxy-L-arabinose transferase-like glycosyltransferase [Bacillus fengqiuensis]|nr:4-amino-4-deoxy-L-arabinose transferase-like glycosyltransferase [Bacillus fengqiuensis]
MNMKVKGRIDFFLVGIIVLSFFLNFYQLKDAGSNTYYTVAVKSMLTSFHTFFYASFDPAGFITVDKPPVALWIQTLSAYLFGLSDFSVLLPEALAGVISVWLMYIIVKPKFGRIAALLSSLVLACSPIFVAVVRTNNVDSILILTLLIATWALMKSVEKQKVGWLILSVALVGVGFNIKMLQAYMVLPAFYLFYLIAVKVKWTKRIVHLVMATIVLASVSLSWPLVVELTPEDERPYIGGSETNSAIELALGYNGVSRLTGQNGPGGGGTQGTGQQDDKQQNQQEDNSQQDGNELDGNQQENLPSGLQNTDPDELEELQKQFGNNGPPGDMPDDGRGGQGQGMSGMFGTGDPGVLRLFSTELSGQISFLLPFALFGVIALSVHFFRKREWDIQHKFALFWVAWLIPMMVFFSIAKFFHQYYLSMMGPAIAALVGIGWTVLWHQYKEKKGWESWLLPVSVLATFLFEALIIYQNKDSVSQGWLAGAIAGGIFFSTILVVMKKKEKVSFYLSVAGVLALLVIPLYWTWITIHKEGNSMTPIAGPSSEFGRMMGANMGGSNGGPGGQMDGGANSSESSSNNSQSEENTDSAVRSDNRQPGGQGRGPMETLDTKLLSYLEKNYDGEKWFLAVPSAQSAYSFMLNTDYAVMAMGGFSGSDQVLTSEKLEEMTKNGEIKYFLIGGDGRPGQSESATEWIKENCEEVPSSEWQSEQQTESQQPFNMNQTMKLYKYKG